MSGSAQLSKRTDVTARIRSPVRRPRAGSRLHRLRPTQWFCVILRRQQGEPHQDGPAAPVRCRHGPQPATARRELRGRHRQHRTAGDRSPLPRS